MRNKKGLVLICSGLVLLAAALGLCGYNLWDEHRAAESVNSIMLQMDTVLPKPGDVQLPEGITPDYIAAPQMEMPTVMIDKEAYIGRIDVPSLELSLPVMSEWSYPNLKIAPCRYTGSAYQDDLVIAAHNYPQHFGKLKDLSLDETVTFTDVDGNVFTYLAREIEQLDPSDVVEMVENDWDLTLFTCTRGGQFRVTVRCERVEEQ